METETFNFWQDHSTRYLEMAFRTDRRERLKHADAYGKRTGDCGDTVEFFLMVDRGIIQSVTFDTDGCINTNACANTVALYAEGRRIEKAWEIMPEDIVAYLQTLPQEQHHCAELAVGALYLALSNYRETLRDPWKKVYSRR